MTRVLDAAMPSWDHRSRHTLRTDLPPAALLTAAEELQWREVPVFRLLMTLRGLAWPGVTSRARVLDWFTSSGFRVVQRSEEQLALISVQPVRRGPRTGTSTGASLTPGSLAAFRSYREPRAVRIGVDFTAGGGILATETRVQATDARARRVFAVYWLLIRAGSGLIRRVWLRAIRSRARRAASPGAAGRPSAP
jgi:hypothetical protein